ncbi:caspase family protein [Myxococcota bacterium]|nr:caspase family protein [Myxococcota bacterium]
MPPTPRLLPPASLALLALSPPAAAAEAAAAAVDAPSPGATYALVVGSNRPGPGQRALRFADQDAAAMAEVLTHAGGLDAAHLVTLANPDAEALLHALDGFGEVLAAEADAGRRTTFVFYYSGHARAQGLDLGDEVVPLSDLRSRLEGLDATVTLAVLDACQSGAVTEAKGVAPAADFSTSSVAGLSTEGFAVIASSSDTELSQESESLGAGVFSHHLQAGLRGAADEDSDGAITLDEAYAYAYHRTLVTTAATQVGAQHVTLETDLRGQGALVLTRPQAATARLRLPTELQAEVLVVRQPQERVVAEIHKAAGRPFELALVPGEYEALVRQGDKAESCTVRLSTGVSELPTVGCSRVKVEQVATRGEGGPAARVETFFMEHSVGANNTHDDPYQQRLVDFGFGEAEDAGDVDTVYTLGLAFGVTRHLTVVGGLGSLDNDRRAREVYGVAGDQEDDEYTFRWSGWRSGVYGRLQLPLVQEWLVPYAQAGGGLGWGTTRFTTQEETEVQKQFGPVVAGGLGLQFMPRFGDFRGFGLFWQSELVYAPIIHNLLGDRHDSGGIVHQLGIRGGF